MEQKELSPITLDDYILVQTMCHDGFGWDINDFDFICSKCGEKNMDTVKVTEITKDRKGG